MEVAARYLHTSALFNAGLSDDGGPRRSSFNHAPVREDCWKRPTSHVVSHLAPKSTARQVAMNLQAEKETRDNGVITASGIINQHALGPAAKRLPPGSWNAPATAYINTCPVLFLLSFFLSFLYVCHPRQILTLKKNKTDFRKKCVCTWKITLLSETKSISRRPIPA